MKKETILKTAVCRFQEDEGVFVVQSPLFDRVIGAETSEEQAWNIYHELLDEMWEAHLEGKLADHAKPGRPAKGIVNINVQVTPEIRATLRKNAKALAVSQGDFVAFAITVAQAYLASPPVYADAKAYTKTFNGVAERGSIQYRAAKKAKPIKTANGTATGGGPGGSRKNPALTKAVTKGKIER